MFEEFKHAMFKEFEMTDCGPMSFFLGIEVKQQQDGISISQKKYAKELLEKFRMSNCNPVGRKYELVITTYAGFFRYHVEDILQATGFHNSPQFHFIPRKNVWFSIDKDKTDESELKKAMENASELLREFETCVVCTSFFRVSNCLSRQTPKEMECLEWVMMFELHLTYMEFKYRVGEDPFPTLGGVLGRENRRSDLMRSRDLLRREMKERIREDIMEMRREIEDEVIMEMAIEREISMRAEAGLMSSSLSSQPLGFQRNLQRTAGLFPIRTHQRLLERDGGEKAVPVLSGKNAGAVTDKGVSVDDGATRIDSDIGDKEDELLCKSSMNDVLAGSKRKADLIGNLELASPKKAHNNWNCPLCQVSTTCEQALNEHFKGKKHKARERVLVEKSIATRNGPEPQQVCSIDAGKPMVSFLRCHYCNVLCNNEVVMAAHLKGKKHVARTACLQKPVEGLGGTIPDIITSMKDVPIAREEVMRTENVRVKETFDSKEKAELSCVLASETIEEVPVGESEVVDGVEEEESPVVGESEVVDGVEEEAKIAVAALQDDVETQEHQLLRKGRIDAVVSCGTSEIQSWELEVMNSDR
ncbi:hypothetical protein MRB53_023943 [Persea americana]|uniref:Uncharacterized protein n=1 Tax=Persea americana TaxID=3435 RepID=A0ACC2LBJ0_PERAE|nr:hypothetical protein MRB53_023943 [Persea americana]